MPVLQSYRTPAWIQDFPQDSPEQQLLDALWNANVTAFVAQARTGNPWTGTNQQDQTCYFDPLTTDVPEGTKSEAKLVEWISFPNRLYQYLGIAPVDPPNPYKMPADAILKLADTGEGFQPIPDVFCPSADWSGPLIPYRPYGPRGWLDEYCEWSVTRDPASGKIVRIDFTCENPEYFYTLWHVSPERVAEVYQDTLNAGAPAERQITVTVDDLSLKDSNGEVVYDPYGRPLYNPLNKWNVGTESIRGQGAGTDTGGAMHLTSTPNTLQTEIGEVAGATIPRTSGNSDPQALVCCAQTGQAYRNSDPHILQVVNQLVAPGNMISLTDPVGLFIQEPDWDFFGELPGDPHLPSGADVSQCWQLVRGSAQLTDPWTGQPFMGHFGLHGVFQLPLDWVNAGVSFTVGDLTVEDDQGDFQPLRWAGQISQTMKIATHARALRADPPAVQPCVGGSNAYPQPLQLFFEAAWNGYYPAQVPNPMNHPISLASNTTMAPPVVEQGSSGIRMALTYSSANTEDPPSIAFTGTGLAASDVGTPADVEYAVPGNTSPGAALVVGFTLEVDADAETGLHGLVLTDSGGQPGPPAPGFVNVVASS